MNMTVDLSLNRPPKLIAHKVARYLCVYVTVQLKKPIF
jgi:hypothetical protein